MTSRVTRWSVCIVVAAWLAASGVATPRAAGDEQ
jgi:hypothetical protein